MATKLQLYNLALLYLKERPVTLTENREPRRRLDEVYDAGGIDGALEEGLWKFATRTVKIDYDTSITTEFGHQYAFAKPTDWIKTVAMCSDEYFRQPLIDYSHQAGYWTADVQAIYLKYVSNGATFGSDLSIWPRSFLEFAAAYFAKEIHGKLKGVRVSLQDVERIYEDKRSKARSNDAWNQPERPVAQGNWTRSRHGRTGTGRDFGNTGSLIG